MVKHKSNKRPTKTLTATKQRNVKEFRTIVRTLVSVANKQTNNKTTNFIENWKITDYITFPPANSL